MVRSPGVGVTVNDLDVQDRLLATLPEAVDQDIAVRAILLLVALGPLSCSNVRTKEDFGLV